MQIERLLQKNNTVQNAFGFKKIFFDRPDNNFTEAPCPGFRNPPWQLTVMPATSNSKKNIQNRTCFYKHDSMSWQWRKGRIPF